MRKSRIVAAVAAAAALAAGGAYLARGDRYRLYVDSRAAHCWRAIRSLALPSSSLRPVRVGIDTAGPDGPTEVTIEYLLDRALAGATLDASCVYPDGGERARSISVGDTAIDAATLSRINRVE